MIRYSCDRCRRQIDSEIDTRYVVHLESYVEIEPLGDDEPDDDRDYLAEIQDVLEQEHATGQDELLESGYQRKRYDLCAECYREFIKNPIGSEMAAPLGFSNN